MLNGGQQFTGLLPCARRARQRHQCHTKYHQPSAFHLFTLVFFRLVGRSFQPSFPLKKGRSKT
jgi:hypothetical protein